MNLDQDTMNNSPRPVGVETSVKVHLAPPAPGHITGPGAPQGQPAAPTFGKPHDGSVVTSAPCVSLPPSNVVTVKVDTHTNNADLVIA